MFSLYWQHAHCTVMFLTFSQGLQNKSIPLNLWRNIYNYDGLCFVPSGNWCLLHVQQLIYQLTEMFKKQNTPPLLTRLRLMCWKCTGLIVVLLSRVWRCWGERTPTAGKRVKMATQVSTWDSSTSWHLFWSCLGSHLAASSHLHRI